MSATLTLQDLRARAAVLSHFEADWLATADLADDSVIEDLLAACERVTGPDGKRHWALDDSVRRGVVATAGFDALRAAWQEVRRRPDDERQQALDAYFRPEPPRPLDGLDPAELRSVQWLAGWLGGAAPHIPDSASVRRVLGRRELSASFRQMAGPLFVGRADVLEALAEQPNGTPLLLHGVGGIGKSALLGHHLSQIADGGLGYVGYITFEHSGMDPARPATIVAALARQLVVQVDAARADEAEHLAGMAASEARDAAKADRSGERAGPVTPADLEPLVDLLRRLLAGRRYVIAFDAFEEVQRRDQFARLTFGALCRALSELPRTAVVLAGRSPAPEAADEIMLTGLSRPEAATLLRGELGELAAEVDVDSVLDVVGLSPLCVRLAAGILRHGPDDEAMRGLALHRGTVEGELYRRLLGAIDDAEVRRLAHPGLTLRRVTADLIREVLAGPCGVTVPDGQSAERLFRGLAREAMLVVRDASQDTETLVHRGDVRQMMLPRLAADEPDATARIHRAAVRYYSHREGIQSRAEELYHRLMLRQTRRTLDSRWDDEALPELLASLDELPPSSKAYIASKSAEVSLSEEDLALADRETRLAVLLRQIRDDLAAGQVVTALDKIRAFPSHGGTADLDLLDLEIQVLARLGRIDDAAEIADRCRKRAARAGRIPDLVKFTLHLARLTEGRDDPVRADELIAGAQAVVNRLPPDPANLVDQLTLTVYRLRLIRKGVPCPAEQLAELTEQALRLYDALPPRVVGRRPGLLRDLAAEVGDRSPKIQRAALRGVGLARRARPTSDDLFAVALDELDERVSSERGIRAGSVKPRRRRAIPDLDERMVNILDEYPREWSLTAAELVTDVFRAQSDAAVRTTTVTARIVSIRAGSLFGSGFVIAPRLVVTVAHVVGAQGASVLVSGAAGPDRYVAVVAWRSRTTDQDVALLEVTDERWRPPLDDPPGWGRLVTRRPDVTAEVWGLPRQPSPIHDPLRAVGRLTVHESMFGGAPVIDIPTGSGLTLSGAAVFCAGLLTGLVTGRGRGRLTFVAVEAFLTDLDCRTILAEHLRQPAPPSMPVELAPLTAGTPPITSRPTDLLSPTQGVVPFQGRAAEMERLRDWCHRAGPVVLLLHGSGGSGKTRTAWNLLRRQEREGWATCWLSQDSDAEVLGLLESVEEPLLVVIDYAELRPTQVSVVLGAVRRKQGPHPVRILLVARSRGDWWQEVKELAPVAEPLLDAAVVVRLEAWPREQAVAAYREATRIFARLLRRDVAPGLWPASAPSAESAASRLPVDALPLTVYMTALVDVLDAGSAESAEALAVEGRMLLHERRYWRRTAVDARLLPTLDEPELFDALAVALLLGAGNGEQGELLIGSVLPKGARNHWINRAVHAWIGALYPGADGRPWGELQPDRLAEHLLGDRLLLNDHLLDPALAHATPAQLELLLVRCARAAQQKGAGEKVATRVTQLCLRQAERLALPALSAVTKVEAPDPLLRALTQLVRDEDTPQDLLVRLADGLPGRSLRLADFAIELSQRIARQYRETAAPLSLADMSRLARAVDEVAVRLARQGRYEEALDFSRETVLLYRRLVVADEDGFRAGLATSLSNLSVNLYELGMNQEGLVAVEEAVAIRRRLAADHPEANLSDLAASLNNLGTQLWRTGRRVEALEAGQEAVRLYRRLAAQNPEEFLPALAMSLSNASVDLGESGRPEEGLIAVREAVAIRRRLAADHPDAFLPDLAASLINSGALLGPVGRGEEAVAADTEGVALYRRLAAQSPERFLPDLAMALNNLSVDLGELGRKEEALTVVREAAGLHENLAARSPERFLPQLARTLVLLSRALADVGQLEEALSAGNRAVAVYEDLSRADPDAYISGLAAALVYASVWLSGLGRLEEALALAQRAVAIRRRLAETDPDTHVRDLFLSLTRLSACLGDLGRSDEALSVLLEAVKLPISA